MFVLRYLGKKSVGYEPLHLSAVMPAEARIHFDLRASIKRQNGFPLARE